MSIDKKTLKKKYQELPADEKARLGEAIVKVNMGVSTPSEIRMVAAFLKGSEFIAKVGGLDDLMAYLHEDESIDKNSPKSSDKTSTVSGFDDISEDEMIREMEEHDEDDEPTAKVSINHPKK